MSMRFRLLALALMLLPAGCASAPAEAPSAAAVLAAAKAASGGAAWDRIEGLTERGSHGGMAYRTWIDFRRRGMRMESGEGEATRVHGYDGETDWTARGAGPALPSRDPAALRETITTFYFSNNGYFFPDRFPAATRYLREQADGNRRFDAIEVAPQGGRPVELWFDKASHLLARIVDRTGSPPVAISASDYRRVSGVMVAFGATVRTMDGTIVDEGRIDSIEYGPVDPRLFDPPAP
jgi:hypothetical protein